MWRNHFATLLPRFNKLKTTSNSGLQPSTRCDPFVADIIRHGVITSEMYSITITWHLLDYKQTTLQCNRLRLHWK